MTGKLTLSFKDYDSEGSSVEVRATQLTAANFDAQTALRNAFNTALADITLFTSIGNIFYGNNQLNSVLPSSNPLCQREIKWKVMYHETADPSKVGFFTIPGADLAKLDSANRGEADLAEADVAAFVTAAEAYVLSQDGAAITIDRIVFVGRNS